MSRDRTARTRIRQFLAADGPVVDPSGYATNVLKDAIGYTGSSVAFIQLIAALDRDDEIEREIRGKRTYRISGVGIPALPTVVPAMPAAQAASTGPPTIELDYQKLAQALVHELLSTTEAAPEDTAAQAVVTADAERDQLVAERDEYMRRLEIARRQLDELLGGPDASSLRSEDTAAHRVTS